MTDASQMTPDEFRAHIVDYLYDELEGPARAAFESTMRDSEALRREVEQLARTLRLSRRKRAAGARRPPS